MCVHIIHTHTPLSNFASCIYENTLHKRSEYSYFKIYLSLVDSLFCVNLCCTVNWFSYTHIYSFLFFSWMPYYGILNIVPCTVQQDDAVYSLYNSLHLLIPNSQSIPSPFSLSLDNNKSEKQSTLIWLFQGFAPTWIQTQDLHFNPPIPSPN